jgi:hypothetical protein
VSRPLHLPDWLWLLLLTFAALLIHGYQFGVEDQAIYLAGIKRQLDPGLYPHDAVFFLVQTGNTLFDELIAASVRATRLPLDLILFAWHLATVFATLFACRRLARRCFTDPAAQWSGVALVAVLLTLPVAGTRLLIFDQYLHARNFATPALLLALDALLDRRASVLAWLAAGAVLHPQMIFFGAFHLLFQAWRPPRVVAGAIPVVASSAPGGAAWREVMLSRHHHFPLRWQWYEQLGAVAPPVLLAWFARLGRRLGAPALAHISGRLALSCGLGVAGAAAITLVPGLERLVPMQSMRTLHFVYLLLFLLGGGLLGQFVLQNRPARWALLFIPLAAGMCYAQLRVFPASPHLHWPGTHPENGWLQAFEWIRQNTPRDALFALDPRYMERPGADFHGFRALAERSMLAEYFKDRGLSAIFPDVALQANLEIRDRESWAGLRADDFRRLRKKHGVSWVVLERPGVPGLSCPYENREVLVCRID